MKWLAYPLALHLLSLLPALMLLGYLSWRQRRKALAELGSLPAVKSLLSLRRRGRLLRGLCFFAGMTVLSIGVAGPQWGRDHDALAAVSGRDLVVVLDLSRSMLAEQPSRQERALRALHDLADTLQVHGGHRVALVIFAARPKLVFPLTNDYDHFRFALSGLDADNLPPELRPHADEQLISGTRIGAALQLAVQTHDPRFQGVQDILLISDGDDPANDKEWRQGALAAREKKIPVHVIGVGDPVKASRIPHGGDVIRHDGKVVTSRLQEKPLEEIAQTTGGLYVSAQTRVLPLGQLFRTALEPRGQRAVSEVESTADLPLLKPRYPWFFAAALGFLTLTMLIPECKRRGKLRPAVSGAWLIPLALVLVSADAPPPRRETPPSPVDYLVREGNEAFSQEDPALAVKLYGQAEERATDPGLVAFNKGVALYVQEHYRDAELHFLRCLEDQQAPPSRRARAYYDLANCLVKQAQADDPGTLERAVTAYRACLPLAGADAQLLADARHNLELASILWLRARAAAKSSPDNPDQRDDHNPNTDNRNPADDLSMRRGRPGEPGDKGLEKTGAEAGDQDGNKKLASAGKLLNLPDQDELVPLPPKDVLALLDAAARRIQHEGRDYRRHAVPLSEKILDW